jgi:hypothetical protein
MPVTLTINRVTAHCDPETSGQDFYAKVTIGLQDFDTQDDAGDDDNSINPNWTFTNPEVDVTLTNLQITIEIWDMDGGWPFGVDPDDPVDIHPDADKTWVLIFYNATNGEWTVEEGVIGPDDDQPPGHAGVWRGADGDDCAEIEFDLSDAFTGDSDQDGLLDNWEQFGIDSGGDGVIDIDLPAMGADPQHKDIFIELDWMVQPVAPGAHSHEPLQQIWTPLWHAFDDSPVTNPDNTTGIHLHVDTGTLYTAGASGPFDCDFDGVFTAGDMDCDGDGIIDIGNLGALTDPPLAGGGNQLPETQFLDFRGDGAANDFYAVKAFNFLANRYSVFHYAVFSHSLTVLRPAMSGRAEIFGNDINVSLGTRAGPVSPISGLNVVGTVAQQAGTLMHELGHNLNLRHGGGDDQNYKPNYLSVMNYDHQQGVLGLAPYIGLDYSPNNLPLMTGGLDENDLDECIPLDDQRVGVTAEWTLDAAAAFPQFVPASGTASFADWNFDNFGNADDGVNCGTANTALDLNFRNANVLEQIVLSGHDDWTGGDLRLDFRHSADYDDGAPAEMVEEIELDEELEIEAARPDVIELSSPDQFCSNRTVINFDNFPPGTVIANQYPGVHIIDPDNMEPKTRDGATRPFLTVSIPNSLFAQPIPPSSFGITLDIVFDNPQYRVGMYIGNGGGGTQARLRAYDAGFNLIGEVEDTTDDPVDEFLGIHSFAGGIRGVRIDFPFSSLAEEIDNLVYDSCAKDPITPPVPTTPFDYLARAESAARTPQDAQNADIIITPLDGVALTINGAGHNSPYEGQIGRGAELNLQAPLLALDAAGRRLFFHHWRMDEFLSFARGERSITVNADHNATFTAVYLLTQNAYFPVVLR